MYICIQCVCIFSTHTHAYIHTHILSPHSLNMETHLPSGTPSIHGCFMALNNNIYFAYIPGLIFPPDKKEKGGGDTQIPTEPTPPIPSAENERNENSLLCLLCDFSFLLLFHHTGHENDSEFQGGFFSWFLNCVWEGCARNQPERLGRNGEGGCFFTMGARWIGSVDGLPLANWEGSERKMPQGFVFLMPPLPTNKQ